MSHLDKFEIKQEYFERESHSPPPSNENNNAENVEEFYNSALIGDLRSNKAVNHGSSLCFSFRTVYLKSKAIKIKKRSKKR